MKAIKDVGMMFAATGIAAALLAVYFNWRARLLGQFRGRSHEH
jgi:hypothetical protein